ncbi:MAG: hypothetical protein B7Z55_08125 [Planctomycetales bacterium 12-60-4]|nr:MAG: hypothetical protein B7Z55_08125 [Planctomycetales bacterium 12-60-4]
MTLRIVSTVCCALLATSCWADIDSGPKVGEKLSALKVQLVQDGKAADAADVLPEHAEHPTVYVFLSGERFDRPAARYLRGVDEAVQKLQRRDPLAGLVIVWLTPDPVAGAERVSRIQQSLRLQAGHWTVFPGAVTGPEGWSVNDAAIVTTVLANSREVSARFGYDSVNETSVPDLDRAIAKLTGQ